MIIPVVYSTKEVCLDCAVVGNETMIVAHCCECKKGLCQSHIYYAIMNGIMLMFCRTCQLEAVEPMPSRGHQFLLV